METRSGPADQNFARQFCAEAESNRVAHDSHFSFIFASFFVSFFMKFGGGFAHLAGKNGMKNAIKNDEKWLL